MSIHLSFAENARAENVANAKSASASPHGGSLLMRMAMILGKIADSMGEKIIGKAEELDKPSSKKSENKLTAELQAQTQIMNMFVQAMNTAIKSIGEANKDVARKQ